MLNYKLDENIIIFVKRYAKSFCLAYFIILFLSYLLTMNVVIQYTELGLTIFSMPKFFIFKFTLFYFFCTFLMYKNIKNFSFILTEDFIYSTLGHNILIISSLSVFIIINFYIVFVLILAILFLRFKKNIKIDGLLMAGGCTVCLLDIESCLCKKAFFYGGIAYEYPAFFGLNKNALSISHLYKFFNGHDVYVHFEGLQKVEFLQAYKNLNVLDPYNMKIWYPFPPNNNIANTSNILTWYVPKGGDVVLVEDKQIIISEFKYRVKPIEDDITLKNYLHKLVHSYKKKMIIGLQCNDTETYGKILNYTKSFQGREFCFDKADLQKSEVVEELQILPMKPNFEQVLIKNSINYSNKPTTSDLTFAKSIRPFLNQFANETTMINKYPKIFAERLQDSSYNINSNLQDNLIIFKKYFNGDTEK